MPLSSFMGFKNLSDNQKNKLCVLALGLGTLLLYFPTAFFQFIYLDDNQYVFENSHIQAGFTSGYWKWAFGTYFFSNWHPLTLISHTLDWQILGPWAGGHHLVNVLFHLFNTLLIYHIFKRTTHSPGKAFLVAALFSWHPVKVESVAWISERKDMLSTFFILLSLSNYVDHIQKKIGVTKNKMSWALCFLFYLLSLMSKSMYVTLPAILLVFDFWPLERRDKKFSGFILEKTPFIFLSVIFSWIAIQAQASGGGIQHFADYSLPVRLANLAQSYWDYLWLYLWPEKLSVFYPFVPNTHVSRSQIIGLGLLLFTGILFLKRKNCPAAWAGWCLFGISLLPVIGIIKIGAQWIACRYLYWPATGLSILFIWGSDFLASAFSVSKRILSFFAIGILAISFVLCSNYLGQWQNSYKLFYYSLHSVPNNWVAHVNLRAAYGRDGNHLKAAEHLIEAIQIFPDVLNRTPLNWFDFYMIGKVLQQRGKNEIALSYLKESARLLAALNPAMLTIDSEPQRINLKKCLPLIAKGNILNCQL